MSEGLVIRWLERKLPAILYFSKYYVQKRVEPVLKHFVFCKVSKMLRRVSNGQAALLIQFSCGKNIIPSFANEDALVIFKAVLSSDVFDCIKLSLKVVLCGFNSVYYAIAIVMKLIDENMIKEHMVIWKCSAEKGVDSARCKN